MGWLLRLIFQSIGELLPGIVEAFAGVINNIFQIMYEISHELKFDKLQKYAIVIAMAMVGVIVIKICFQVYILQTDGDPDAEPLELITRIAVTVAVIMAGGPLITYGVQMAGTLMDEISKRIVPDEKNVSETTVDAIYRVLLGNNASMFICLTLFTIIIISLLIFCFQAGKRAAELVLFSILLPIVALDLLTTNRERWNSFFTELMLAIFGYLVQMISFNIFLMLYAKAAVDLTFPYLIASMSWLLIVLSSPKWLQKFIYSSGTGDAAKGGARTASYILPSIIMRK